MSARPLPQRSFLQNRLSLAATKNSTSSSSNSSSTPSSAPTSSPNSISIPTRKASIQLSTLSASTASVSVSTTKNSNDEVKTQCTDETPSSSSSSCSALFPSSLECKEGERAPIPSECKSFITKAMQRLKCKIPKECKEEVIRNILESLLSIYQYVCLNNFLNFVVSVIAFVQQQECNKLCKCKNSYIQLIRVIVDTLYTLAYEEANMTLPSSYHDFSTHILCHFISLMFPPMHCSCCTSDIKTIIQNNNDCSSCSEASKKKKKPSSCCFTAQGD